MTHRIAIVSPSLDIYSETFIQAQKDLLRLKNDVHFLYGGTVPRFSDFTRKKISPISIIDKTLFKIKYKISNTGLSKQQFTLLLYLKKHRIQCVLAEYGNTGAQIYQVCNQLKIPLIVHFHGYDASEFDVLAKNKAEYQKMFSVAKYIIGVSQIMMEKLKSLGANESRLIYNTYGPNDAFFKTERKPTKFPLFFSVGRFADKKAPYYTIIAYNILLNKYPNSRLIMGGDGPLLATCINLAKYLGIDKNIDFPGIITHGEIIDYLSKATAYVQHSITALNGDMEGTPLSILEASGAGVPVISTRHAGIPDVIINNKTGLLCEEHAYDKMAEHMIWIIEHPKEAERMGAAGRENIKRNYSMSRHIDTLNAIIQKAVNE